MASWLGRWWRQRRKRLVLRRYVDTLGATLAKDYGREEAYSVARIKTALRKHGFSVEFEAHALSMFSCKSDFVAGLEQDGKSSDRHRLHELYEDLRLEASLLNDGSFSFMPKHWEEVGMHNGSDADVVRRWGPGL
jgi:hypothetical protein